MWMESRACGGYEDHTSSSYSAICLQQVYDKSSAGRRNGVRGLEHYRSVGRSATISSVCEQRQNGLTAGRLRRELPRQTTTQLAVGPRSRTMRCIYQQCLITQPPPRAFLNWLRGFPGLFADTSELISVFLHFCSSYFPYLVVGSVR